MGKRTIRVTKAAPIRGRPAAAVLLAPRRSPARDALLLRPQPPAGLRARLAHRGKLHLRRRLWSARHLRGSAARAPRPAGGPSASRLSAALRVRPGMGGRRLRPRRPAAAPADRRLRQRVRRQLGRETALLRRSVAPLRHRDRAQVPADPLHEQLDGASFSRGSPRLSFVVFRCFYVECPSIIGSSWVENGAGSPRDRRGRRRAVHPRRNCAADVSSQPHRGRAHARWCHCLPFLAHLSLVSFTLLSSPSHSSHRLLPDLLHRH